MQVLTQEKGSNPLLWLSLSSWTPRWLYWLVTPADPAQKWESGDTSNGPHTSPAHLEQEHVNFSVPSVLYAQKEGFLWSLILRKFSRDPYSSFAHFLISQVKQEHIFFLKQYISIQHKVWEGPHTTHSSTFSPPFCRGFHCCSFNVYHSSPFPRQVTFVSLSHDIMEPSGFTRIQSGELSSMCLGEMEPVAKEKVSY